MTKCTEAPYGRWKSPIDARTIARGTVGLAEVYLAGKWLYWQELRPSEGGRYVVLRRGPDGAVTEMTPDGFNTRTRVHEYGGGSYLPHDDSITFVNFTDQRLYTYAGRGKPEPVAPESLLRYADFAADVAHGRMIAVQEDHTGDGEPVNSLVALKNEQAGPPTVLAEGNDFYAAPRLSPGGRQLAYLTWNHPDMPWDAAELWVAPVRKDGALGKGVHVAGGPDEAVAQPEWSPDGTLHFISDRTDWWNLYRVRNGLVEPLTDLSVEFTFPQWWFAMSNYAFASADRILCSFCRDGLWQLAMLDTTTRELTLIETPFNTISYVRTSGGQAAFIGGSAAGASAVMLMDLATLKMKEIRRATKCNVEPGYISTPEAITFPSADGRQAYGLFYPPQNQDHQAPSGTKPPLVVKVHGGPTAATRAAMRLDIQYYTSRGVAVFDVNYGGSTGYGRKYRQSLNGNWGVVDVEDCCAGARYLASAGRVDPKRMVITGGSAGGFTTLSCLAFQDVFAAGSSHYGVSDCESLVRE
ncbi:MAG: prolyl oligopeptidase family serine peptidase, partial [Planctomycetota bacterium]